MTIFAASRFGKIYKIKEVKNNKFEIEVLLENIEINKIKKRNKFDL